jgi:hypothetical protein
VLVNGALRPNEEQNAATAPLCRPILGCCPGVESGVALVSNSGVARYRIGCCPGIESCVANPYFGTVLPRVLGWQFPLLLFWLKDSRGTGQSRSMLVIVLSAIAAAAIAFFVLWPYGTIWAGLGAPIAGSITAGLAAIWLARRATVSSSRKAPDAKEHETIDTLKSNRPE